MTIGAAAGAGRLLLAAPRAGAVRPVSRGRAGRSRHGRAGRGRYHRPPRRGDASGSEGADPRRGGAIDRLYGRDLRARSPISRPPSNGASTAIRTRTSISSCSPNGAAGNSSVGVKDAGGSPDRSCRRVASGADTPSGCRSRRRCSASARSCTATRSMPKAQAPVAGPCSQRRAVAAPPGRGGGQRRRGPDRRLGTCRAGGRRRVQPARACARSRPARRSGAGRSAQTSLPKTGPGRAAALLPLSGLALMSAAPCALGARRALGV